MTINPNSVLFFFSPHTNLLICIQPIGAYLISSLTDKAKAKAIITSYAFLVTYCPE